MKQNPLDILEHGTVNGYRKGGCRCDCCTEAVNLYEFPPEHEGPRTQPSVKRRQEFLDEIKREAGCWVCGKTTGRLEFDHIDPSTKEFTISTYVSLERLWPEMEKCHVLCKEHHIIKTSVDKVKF